MEKWMVCLFLFVAIVVGTEAAARTKTDDDSCNQRCADLGFVVRNKRQDDDTQGSSGDPGGRKKRCVCYDDEGKRQFVEDAKKQGGPKLPLNEIKKRVAKRMAANKK